MSKFSKYSLLFLLLLVLAFAVAFGIAVWKNKQDIESGVNTNTSTGITAYMDDPDRIFPGRDDNPSMGLVDASVEVIFFEDFECPICAELFPIKKEIINEYKDRVVFVFRHFPIEALHANAKNAALASECAYEQNKFWEMHDKLYISQAYLDEESLKNYALQIGLDTDRFDYCFDERLYDTEVDKDLKEGYVYTVEGTPTFFVNGEKFEGVPTKEYFKELLDFYLEK